MSEVSSSTHASATSAVDREASEAGSGPSLLGRVAMLWGVAGVVAILVMPLMRLAPLALEAMRDGLSGGQWTVLVAWVVVNAHAEGYRGFHRRFSPKAVARAQFLARNPRPVWVLLAPLFCMSLFHASRRGMMVSRILVVAIFVLVITVRQLDQPWRGIIDAGVVVGLGLGLTSLLYYFVRSLAGHAPPIAPDLPESSPSPEPPDSA